MSEIIINKSSYQLRFELFKSILMKAGLKSKTYFYEAAMICAARSKKDAVASLRLRSGNYQAKAKTELATWFANIADHFENLPDDGKTIALFNDAYKQAIAKYPATRAGRSSIEKLDIE